jgi:hypothetical protein
MPRTLPQRVLRLAVQVAIFLALMIGVLLRMRSGSIAWWEVLLRPVIIFGLGMALLSGRRWLRWPLAGLLLAYAAWYVRAAMRPTLPGDYRIGTAVGAILEMACVAVVLAIAPVPDAPGRSL